MNLAIMVWKGIAGSNSTRFRNGQPLRCINQGRFPAVYLEPCGTRNGNHEQANYHVMHVAQIDQAPKQGSWLLTSYPQWHEKNAAHGWLLRRKLQPSSQAWWRNRGDATVWSIA
jgi:hypothetical protein